MKQQQKMQNNLSEERLRKDNDHFLELTRALSKEKRCRRVYNIDENLIVCDIYAQ